MTFMLYDQIGVQDRAAVREQLRRSGGRLSPTDLERETLKQWRGGQLTLPGEFLNLPGATRDLLSTLLTGPTFHLACAANPDGERLFFPVGGPALRTHHLSRLGLPSSGGYLTIGGHVTAPPDFLNAYNSGDLHAAERLARTLHVRGPWAELHGHLRGLVSAHVPRPGAPTRLGPVTLPEQVQLSPDDARALTHLHGLTRTQPYLLSLHWYGPHLARHEVYTPAGVRVPIRPPSDLNDTLPRRQPDGSVTTHRMTVTLNPGSDAHQAAMSLDQHLRRGLLNDSGFRPSLTPDPHVTHTARPFIARG